MEFNGDGHHFISLLHNFKLKFYGRLKGTSKTFNNYCSNYFVDQMMHLNSNKSTKLIRFMLTFGYEYTRRLPFTSNIAF